MFPSHNQCLVVLYYYLKAKVQELSEDLQAAKESAKTSRGHESVLRKEVDSLNQDLQRCHKAQRRAQVEKEECEKEVHILKQQNKRLSAALQVSVWEECCKSSSLVTVFNLKLWRRLGLSSSAERHVTQVTHTRLTEHEIWPNLNEGHADHK